MSDKTTEITIQPEDASAGHAGTPVRIETRGLSSARVPHVGSLSIELADGTSVLRFLPAGDVQVFGERVISDVRYYDALKSLLMGSVVHFPQQRGLDVSGNFRISPGEAGEPGPDGRRGLNGALVFIEGQKVESLRIEDGPKAFAFGKPIDLQDVWPAFVRWLNLSTGLELPAAREPT